MKPIKGKNQHANMSLRLSATSLTYHDVMIDHIPSPRPQHQNRYFFDSFNSIKPPMNSLIYIIQSHNLVPPTWTVAIIEVDLNHVAKLAIDLNRRWKLVLPGFLELWIWGLWRSGRCWLAKHLQDPAFCFELWEELDPLSRFCRFERETRGIEEEFCVGCFWTFAGLYSKSTISS